MTFSVLNVGQIKLHHANSTIILQKTFLGWIAAGGKSDSETPNYGICNIVKLDKLIEQFWVIEDLDHEPIKSRDELACEEHYVKNTTRDSSGRYVVRLPFRDNKFDLGSSKQQALRRFYALERKFEANPAFKGEYVKVMEEYISLGHMTPCDDHDDNQGEYYLPHHAMIKESSETTKLRVVFDPSSKTSTGLSLNAALMVDPTIQDTIFEQIIRFRGKRYVIAGHIQKIYRQILVHSDDHRFQKTLWYVNGKIKPCYLNTITFGTASAPFLAIRTLKQLAIDEAQTFPRASKLISRDFYVDDFISGANSLEDIIGIRDEMTLLLQRGGFPIRKWASNHPETMDAIPQRVIEFDGMARDNLMQNPLGIVCNTHNDLLQYNLSRIDLQRPATKRKLLSEISKIFDPLGLLGPVILYAKDLIQDCWKAKVTWDESLPQSIHTKWLTFSSQLSSLREVTFPRQILLPHRTQFELHGFCDVSTHGYGACLFARSIDSQGKILIRLIYSKSRVAPLSGMTIQRLELCAASILIILYVKVNSQVEFPIHRIILWSDSTIVLCWLKKPRHLLRTFESNRVAEIQSLGDQVESKHIRSEDIPADPLSRGQLPFHFINNSLWMSGPTCLSLPESKWPQFVEPIPKELPGIKKNICLVTSTAWSVDEIFSRFSVYEKFVRVVAYICRWKLKSSTVGKPTRLHPDIEDTPQRVKRIIDSVRPLTPIEILNSEIKILTLIQRERFSSECKHLSKSSNTIQKGPFTKLCPFIGTVGVICVGGRLEKSELLYNPKHPILLP